MDERTRSATKGADLRLDAAAKAAAEAVRQCGGRPVKRFLNRFTSYLLKYPADPRHLRFGVLLARLEGLPTFGEIRGKRILSH
jgi:hypothetical protein